MIRMIAGMTNEHKTMHWAIVLMASKKELLQEAFADHQNLSEHSNIAVMPLSCKDNEQTDSELLYNMYSF